MNGLQAEHAWPARRRADSDAHFAHMASHDWSGVRARGRILGLGCEVSSGNFTLERGSTCWGQALPLLFCVIVAIASFRVVVTSRAAKSVNLLL